MQLVVMIDLWLLALLLRRPLEWNGLLYPPDIMLESFDIVTKDIEN
jgi:hypothetical protein